MLRDHQILDDAHAWKEPDVLERAHDARVARDPVTVHALKQEIPPVLALERHPADIRPVKPGDAVEGGRLARAIGPDDRGDVAAPGAERQIVDGDEAAEPDRQMLDGQNRIGGLHRHALSSLGAANGLYLARRIVGSR